MSKILDNQQREWEAAYVRGDNFVFYPHEEIIRFFARYIVKRTGLDSFQKRHGIEDRLPRVLDLGCGIGRHILFSHHMQTEAYGIDLSHAAVTVAREWAAKEGVTNPEERILQCDISDIPFDDAFFDFIISHGVLDSMSIANAAIAVRQAARLLRPGGYFYCDLVSGDSGSSNADYVGEEIVAEEHEKGTIQLYYNKQLIDKLFNKLFSTEEAIYIKREEMISGESAYRYHFVFRKK